MATDPIDRIFTAIRERMSGGGCPTDGCLGECAAIFRTGETPDGRPVWEAYCYIWRDDFHDSTAFAQWFRAAGARSVTVRHVLFDEDNDDRDGRGVCGRAWNVTFLIDQPAATHPRRAVPFAVVERADG